MSSQLMVDHPGHDVPWVLADGAPRGDGHMPRPLLITADDHLLDDVLRMAAAAGVELTHSRDAGCRAAWRDAPTVLVDELLVGELVAARLGRRSGVVVLARSAPTPSTWSASVALGVDRVLQTGQDDVDIVAALADTVAGGPDDGRCVAVIGGCGGAGATVFALALAAAAVRDHPDVLLVDADPIGSGLDALVGIEDRPGVRWTDLTAPTGRLDAHTLLRAVPAAASDGGPIPVLAYPPGPIQPVDAAVADVVLDGCRRAGVLTVVDLPRHPQPVTDRVLERADLTVLVVPADVRACLAARRLVPVLSESTGRCGLVVRGPSPGGLSAQEVADVLDLPLWARMRALPAVARDAERGIVPTGGPRDALSRAAGAVLDLLDPVAV